MEARPATPSGTQEARFLLDTNLYLHPAKKAGPGAASVSHAQAGRGGALRDYVWGIGVRGGEKRAADGEGKKKQIPHCVRDDIGGEGRVFFQGSLAARRAAGRGAGTVAGAGASASRARVAGDGGGGLRNDSCGS